MRPYATLAAAVLVALASGQSTRATSITIDIGGFEVFGGLSAEFPSFSPDFGGPGTVTELAITATGETLGGSFASDITFDLRSPLGSGEVIGPDVGFGNVQGAFAASGAAPVSVDTADGLIDLTLYEIFVDDGSPDLAFDAGSTLTLSFEPYAPVAPPVATNLGVLAAENVPFAINTFGSGFDTELAAFDAGGVLLDLNDDAGGTRQSELTFASGLAAGDYFLTLTGWETVFGLGFAVDSTRGDGGDYTLNYPGGSTAGSLPATTSQFFSFTVVPEPSTCSLLCLASVALSRRQRR